MQYHSTDNPVRDIKPSNHYWTQSDPTRIIAVIRVNFFQTELMVEICYESLVRAIGKVLLMKFS